MYCVVFVAVGVVGGFAAVDGTAPIVDAGVCQTRMPDEARLRDQARDVIRSGRLPLRDPDRLFGGPGSGAVCAVCGELTTRNSLELKIRFRGHGAMDSFHLHPRCFAAWEFERAKITGPPDRFFI